MIIIYSIDGKYGFKCDGPFDSIQIENDPCLLNKSQACKLASDIMTAVKENQFPAHSGSAMSLAVKLFEAAMIVSEFSSPHAVDDLSGIRDRIFLQENLYLQLEAA